MGKGDSGKKNDQDEDESLDNFNKNKCVTKLQCQRKQVYVGEVVKPFEASFQEVFVHVNTKRIQAETFEADKKKKNVRVFQRDFAMVYEGMYQDEVQSPLWSRGSVNFLQLHSFARHKVKHTSSQQIPNIKIKTQFLYLLNTFMRIFYALACPGSTPSRSTPSRFFKG